MSLENCNIKLYECESVYEEAELIANLVTQYHDKQLATVIVSDQAELLRLLRISFHSHGLQLAGCSVKGLVSIIDTHLPSLLNTIWQLANVNSCSPMSLAALLRHKMVDICNENELLAWQDQIIARHNLISLNIKSYSSEPQWLQSVITHISGLHNLLMNSASFYRFAQAHLDFAMKLINDEVMRAAIMRLKTRMSAEPQNVAMDYMQWLLGFMAAEKIELQHNLYEVDDRKYVRLSSFSQLGSINSDDVIIMPAFNEAAISDALYANARLTFEAKKQKLEHWEKCVMDSMIGKEVLLTRSCQAKGVQTRPPRLLRKLLVLGLKSDSLRPEQGVFKHNNIPTPPQYTLPVNLRPKRLSASATELLMHDPYSFYLRYVLKLNTSNAPISCTKQHFGIALHRSLAEIINPLAVSADEYINTVTKKFKEYFKACKSPLEIATIALWEVKLMLILNKLYAFEIQVGERLQAQKREYMCEMEVDTINGKASIYAIFDRLDRYRSNIPTEVNMAIYDYKTGAPPTQQEMQQGLAPQLPIAAAFVMRQGYTAELGHIPLSYRIAEQTVCWAKIDPLEASEGLAGLINTYLDADTPFIAIYTNNMKYSEYWHLRRQQEWG